MDTSLQPKQNKEWKAEVRKNNIMLSYFTKINVWIHKTTHVESTLNLLMNKVWDMNNCVSTILDICQHMEPSDSLNCTKQGMNLKYK